MLEALLRSWASLIIPENVEVTFLVIENDTEERSRNLIQTLQPIFKSSKLAYALETEPGFLLLGTVRPGNLWKWNLTFYSLSMMMKK